MSLSSTTILSVESGELVESATKCAHRFLNRKREWYVRTFGMTCNDLNNARDDDF